jgi:hypothetical protein
MSLNISAACFRQYELQPGRRMPFSKAHTLNSHTKHACDLGLHLYRLNSCCVSLRCLIYLWRFKVISIYWYFNFLLLHKPVYSNTEVFVLCQSTRQPHRHYGTLLMTMLPLHSLQNSTRRDVTFLTNYDVQRYCTPHPSGSRADSITRTSRSTDDTTRTDMVPALSCK